MSKIAVRDDVAARLREARNKVFSSAAAAARSLDMNPVTVRAHENGQNGIGYYDLERYARRYGVDVAWLLTGRGPIEPAAEVHRHSGVEITILGDLQDGKWIHDPTDLGIYVNESPLTPDGIYEFVVYTDPRFPAEMVNVLRVVSNRTQGEYPNGTMVFAIPSHIIGYREDDHVIVIRRRGEFTEWTLRRVVKGEHGHSNRFQALTSDDPPFEYTYTNDEGQPETDVVGVVIGSITRRQVNLLTLEDRIQEERQREGIARKSVEELEAEIAELRRKAEND